MNPTAIMIEQRIKSRKTASRMYFECTSTNQKLPQWFNQITMKKHPGWQRWLTVTEKSCLNDRKQISKSSSQNPWKLLFCLQLCCITFYHTFFKTKTNWQTMLLANLESSRISIISSTYIFSSNSSNNSNMNNLWNMLSLININDKQAVHLLFTSSHWTTKQTWQIQLTNPLGPDEQFR